MLRSNAKLISIGFNLNQKICTVAKSRNFSYSSILLNRFEDSNTSESIQINRNDINSQIKSAESESQRQINNKPFVKNLFCGLYEYDYLKFPEYDANYKVEELNQDVQPVKNFFDSSSHDQIIDKNGNFDVKALEEYKRLGLYSKSLPKEYNGQELDATGVARIIEETGRYPSLGISLIYNNEVAAKSILLYASAEQKDKYLKRIASGDLKACFCYSELDNGCDAVNFKTTARYNSQEKVYILNGSKAWVSMLSNEEDGMNVKQDSVFVVLCKTTNENIDEDASLNAFLVDKNTPGLIMNKQLSNFNGLNLYEIEFDNVILSEASLMGSEGSGYKISTKLNEISRHLVGAISIGLLKDLFKKTVEFVNDTRRFNKSISEFEFVKDRISDIETKLYTMESMTYMTAGIIDSYEVPDVGCESALTKIYCTETLRTCVNSCLDILAMGSYSNLNEIQTNYLSDLNYLSSMFSTNDFLRLYVATSGTVLAGIEFSDSLVKLRNPLMNPGYALRRIISNYKLTRSVNKKAPEYLYLWEHVHPSLAEPTAILEQCTVKFMMTIKYSLLTYGRDAVDVQFSMKNLANIVMHLYALNSVIARASRAYSIGLHNAQHEIGLVFLQAEVSKRAITEAFDEIVQTRIGRGQENIKTTVAENVFKEKQHAVTHATSRNY